MKHSFCILLFGLTILFSQCAWSRKQWSSEKLDWKKQKELSQSGPEIYRLKDIKDTIVKVVPTKPIHESKKLLMKSEKDTLAKIDTLAVRDALQVRDTSVLKLDNDSFPSLRTWITPELWEQCFPKRFGVVERGTNSKAQGFSDFYTYESFMAAATKFPRFLNEGTMEQRRRELAAFFAHISIETGGLKYKEQINRTKSYAVPHRMYPPVSTKNYHGRGPLQLSYNYNYGLFSEQCYGDKMVMLQDPDKISNDSVVAFTSAIWFWMTPQGYKPACHDVMVGGWTPQSVDLEANRVPGFGLTLNIINAPQCGTDPQDQTTKRYKYYEDFCSLFGVDKGPNAECSQQIPFGKK